MRVQLRARRSTTGRSRRRAGCGIVAVGAILMIAGVETHGGTVVLQPTNGDPIDGLTAGEQALFDQGRLEYMQEMTVGEGLGPNFNQASCAACHSSPIGGAGIETVTRFGRFDGMLQWDPMIADGGPVRQSQTIAGACEETIPPTATVITQRLTRGSGGYGLIQAILDADLLALEDPTDADLDGVSGVAHMAAAFEDFGGPDRVGRFGWKGQIPTILTFTADAALNEMGITNRFLGVDIDPNGDPSTGCDDLVADPELQQDVKTSLYYSDRVSFFQRYLAPPPQTPKSGMTGETIFNTIGCATCHVPSFTTPGAAPLEVALWNRTIRPYSDFLLHDMGDASDGTPQDDAGEDEMLTPPLWGVRVRPLLWHDGRFGGALTTRLTNAILEHGATGSEGANAAAGWSGLSAGDQSLVLEFLESLGRREFDANGDDVVDMVDFLVFRTCYGSTPAPDDACSISDIDQDGDVDIDDYNDGFVPAYSGPMDDCDGNGTLDITDIINGTIPDIDANGVPDSCQCPADFDLNGHVGLADLTLLLNHWGPCTSCTWDLDDDQNVGLADLTYMLNAWGDCPG